MFKWIYKKFFAPLVAIQMVDYTSSRVSINSQFDTLTEFIKTSRKFSSLELEEIGETLANIIEEKVEQEVEEALKLNLSDYVPNAEEIGEEVMQEIINRLRS